MLCFLLLSTIAVCWQPTTHTQNNEVLGSDVRGNYALTHLSRPIVLEDVGMGLCGLHISHIEKQSKLAFTFAQVWSSLEILLVPWSTPTTHTQNYEVLGSDVRGNYALTHLSRPIVLQDVGVGLCGLHINQIEKQSRLAFTFAQVWSSLDILLVPWSTFSPMLSSMTAIAMFVCILGMLFTSCFNSRIQLNSKNRRRPTLGSHIWSRRKIMWRQSRLSRDLYIRYAKNNKLETLFGTCSSSCSKISKPLCGKTNLFSTPIPIISGKTKRIRISRMGRSPVKHFAFITNAKRLKKRIHFRRKSGSLSRSSVLHAAVRDAKVHVITKKKSKAKKVSSGQIPTKRIPADGKELDVGPAYHITPKKVENVYKAMRKGRSFRASKRVLWRNRHRLVLRREYFGAAAIREKEYFCPEPPEEQEDPHMHQTGKEYSSNNGGDGPHSSEEYDPVKDAMRTRKRQKKKAQQKFRKKRRRNADGRSKEYEVRSKRRRLGDSIRDRAGEIKRQSERRQAGDVIRDRAGDIQRQSERRRERNIICNPTGSIWTADALPTDEELKQFVKDPYTAVAAFRLMAGIPVDPRIPSANLAFDVKKII